MKLRMLIIVLVVAALGYVSYYYEQTNEPFSADVAGYVNKNEASKLLNTEQTYDFRIQNTSKYDIELTDIEIEDYAGIEIGSILTEDGEEINQQDLVMPSHTVYNKDGWSTNEGMNFTYSVSIKEPNITNPKKVSLTYKVFGFKRTQTVDLPIIE